MKKLLVVGAGFLQTFVIKKAKELGYTVVTVDANPQAQGFSYADKSAAIDIVDRDACLAFAKEEEIDGVLTAATDYGVLTVSYIAQEMNLPGLNYSAAKRVKNKYQTRNCMTENRVDDTERATEVGENTNVDGLELQYPVMVKPCDGAGSRGVSRVDSKEDLKTACDKAISWSMTRKATIERFVEGREYGAESIVVNGETHVLAIVRKWMTEPPYYAELGHALPNDLPAEIENKARCCVEKAIKALGINFGAVNMDMIITPTGEVHIVDVGARMGGNLIGSHIIEAGTGIDYMAAIVRSAVGDEVNLTEGNSKAVATRILAYGDGVINTMPDMKALEQEYGVVIEHHMHLGDKVNEYHTNLDGCGYVVSVEQDVETAINKAEKVLEEIGNRAFG